MLDFGTYPTPVECLEQFSTAKTALWIKRDDLSHPLYGGSKVRKLGPLLEDAKRRGATRVVTLGAIGSHHVLATGIFGKLAELEVEGIVMPRPQSAHVLETTRATLGRGVRLTCARSYTEALRQLALRVADGSYAIPAGGSNALGTLGLLKAATELQAQVLAGLLPEPDLLVVPLGSGGTAAGLCAGLLQTRLRTRVLAVAVAEPSQVFVQRAHALAKQMLEPELRTRVAARLEVALGYLGEGYGLPSVHGERAMLAAASSGLVLDDTYTAKAFAATIDRVALGREQTILFWNTLSSAPMAPLLLDAPSEQDLPAELRRLALDP